MTNFQQVTATTPPAAVARQNGFTFQGARLIWQFLVLLESLFALRVLLQLIGANLASPLAALLYSFTGVFLVPFAGIATTPAASGAALEISTLIAIVVYALLAWVLERVAWIIFFRPYAAVAVAPTTIIGQRM